MAGDAVRSVVEVSKCARVNGKAEGSPTDFVGDPGNLSY